MERSYGSSMRLGNDISVNKQLLWRTSDQKVRSGLRLSAARAARPPRCGAHHAAPSMHGSAARMLVLAPTRSVACAARLAHMRAGAKGGGACDCVPAKRGALQGRVAQQPAARCAGGGGSTGAPPHV